MKGREFMARPNEVMLVTKQIVDEFVERLLDRNRFLYVYLIDLEVELDNLANVIIHDSGMADILYDLHLIDCETYHNIDLLHDEVIRNIENQYKVISKTDDIDEDMLSETSVFDEFC